MEKRITFFFGAGAEAKFGMPMGAQYTLDTILSKRSQMMDALKDFYKRRPSDYSSSHVAQQLFSNDSHTFREIVHRAARILWYTMDDIDPDSNRIVKLSKYNKNDNVAKKAFFDEVKKVFEYVVIDIDKPHDTAKRPQFIDFKDSPQKYLSLIKNFTYYGSVEKDFSTIINPKEAGTHRFWRLINYFWSAYFAIIIPTLDLSSKYRNNEEYKENKYAYILSNLNEIVRYIYSDAGEFRSEINNEYQSSYYSQLRKAFPNSNAVTTNYTPFLGFADFKNTIYLAGKLSQFEIPEELRVVDICDNEDISDKFIFPYMATQAPLKPIVDCVQLREYSNFIKTLDGTDIVVIIGYNINDNDNHINALLRDFLMRKSTNHIVFCQFVKPGDDFDQENTVNAVTQRLKITSLAAKNQIAVIPNCGSVSEILSTLKQYIIQ